MQKTKIITEDEIWEKLKKVMDPELGCSIVDLGLIYKVAIKDDEVKIDMTLTAPGCPMAQMIGSEVEEAAEKVKGVKIAEVKLVFDPPWTPERMSPELKKKFGFA